MKFVAVFALMIVVAAQEPQFDVQSRLVLVPVTVTDSKGHPVDGLEKNDFVVTDNGRPQKATVDTIATGVAPIALVVAIQTSGISKAVLEKVHKIGPMIQPLVIGEGGCAGVVAFAERVEWVQDCTRDEDALSDAFAGLHTGEPKSARMLDAVKASIDRLGQRPHSRRVLLLISETRDRGSEKVFDEVAMAAQAAGVTVYAATYSAYLTAFTTRSSATAEPKPHQRPNNPSEETGTVTGGPPRCNPNGCPEPPIPTGDQRVDLLGGIGEIARMGKFKTTQALASSTGGATFPFARLKGLEDAIQKLSAELHSQYVLSFMPEDASPGYHALKVQVGSGAYQIRARPGYWSTQGPGR